jgi:hypothetical protein
MENDYVHYYFHRRRFNIVAALPTGTSSSAGVEA